MTAPQRKDTYFSTLTGDTRSEADAWLRDYLRLVIRIYRAHLAAQQVTRNATLQVDASRCTGKLGTPDFEQPSTTQ